MQLLSVLQSSSPYQSLIVLGTIIVAGLFMGGIVEKIKIPYITGYILSGLLIGGVLVLLKFDYLIANLEVVSTVALGFIAYGIGRELVFTKLKNTGVEIIVLTIVQAFLTTLVVSVGLILLGVSVPVSLIFGAIATATEPASIMLLTKKMKTKGPLTDTLIPLVGLDDAVGIIIFGVLLSIAKTIQNGTSLNVLHILQDPLLELLFSAIVGILAGLVVALVAYKTKNSNSDKNDIFLTMSVFGVFLTVAIAKIGLNFGDFSIHLSPILTPMILGVTVTNALSSTKAHDLEIAVDKFVPPILIAFFTIAGAELIIALLGQTDMVFGIMAVVTGGYIVLRIIGKVFGAYLGARMMHSVDSIRKYLGISLLPQAGVALGMAYQARVDFPSEGLTILIVVLIATLFYALIGPIGVKYALTKSKESQL
ncbi:MAG: cation:proton antiporter [Firmicutes bacterium]|nr:cation:proton antiporter [Bacillota bacterium]